MYPAVLSRFASATENPQLISLCSLADDLSQPRVSLYHMSLAQASDGISTSVQCGQALEVQVLSQNILANEFEQTPANELSKMKLSKLMN